MRNINLDGALPILIFVILFLVLPLSTLPGLFNAVFVLLMGIALALAALLVAVLVLGRRPGQGG